VSFHRIPTPQGAPGVVWGFKVDYLLVAVGEGSAEAALARLSPTTKMATWLTSLQEQLPVERPCVTSYINVSAALEAARPLMGSDPHIPAVLQATGLSRLKSIGSVTGLDRKSTMTKTLLATDGPPQGVFAALGSKPLSAADLAPIHKQSNMAMAVRLDLADVYRRVLEGIGQVEPDAREKVQMALGRFEEQLGVRLHDDLLQSLGDVWCLYNSPAEGGARFTGLAATVSIRDRVKIQPAHDRLIEQLRNALAGPGHTGALKEFTYRDTRVYYMQYTGTFMPIAPAWCLTKDHLVIALNPQMIKAYLSRDPQAGSLADLPQIASLVQGGRGPSMLSYQDSSGMWQVLYSYVQMVAPMASGELARQGIRFDLPELPSYAVIGRHITPTVSLARQTEAGIYSERHQSLPGSGIDLTSTGPVAIALLLPAVQAAREAARRAQGTNNMKQIGLAMHNYHDVHRHLPAAAIADKQGRPLLSWRVAILPYIEQQELYQQFKLDEPWDSEHNRKLIAKIPQVYVNPSHPELAAEGKTVYLVLASEGTLFAGPKPPRFAEVLDGTSNTLMCLEVNAERAVVWTKPDDFQVDSKDPLAGLRGARPNGFLAGLADGSVQFVSDSVDPAVLRAMFTRAGGEPIPR
jgi:hypothetical protein